MSTSSNFLVMSSQSILLEPIFNPEQALIFQRSRVHHLMECNLKLITCQIRVFYVSWCLILNFSTMKKYIYYEPINLIVLNFFLLANSLSELF